MLMHSVIYRTQLLRDCGLTLPKHTFYVDELYVYVPLPHVERMYYLDVDFYHYFIGREDQSVQEQVMIRRIDQALLVNRLLISQADPFQVRDEHKRRYMLNYLEIVTTVSSYVLAAGENGRLERRAVATGKIIWGSSIEILRGVTTDDQIAFPYGRSARAGNRTQHAELDQLYGY